MGNVIKKMLYHVPESFMGYNIFLPAYMAIPALHYCTAIEAIFLFSFSNVTHPKIFLKNKQETINGISFSLWQV
jgi:hypothetical protein